MKKIGTIVGIVAIGILGTLGAIGTACAQGTRYETDSTCGCDIFYVDGIQTTREGDRYGFKRDDGTVIAPNIYLHVAQFSDGYCRVWLEDTLCGLLSADGEEVVPCRYDHVELPACGRVLVAKGGRFGYTDLKGNEIIPPTYLNASNFSENRAGVSVVVDSFFHMCTFIDTLGQQLFPPVFQNAMPFSQGYAPVKRYERWGLIDTLGNEVLPTKYEYLTPPDHGIFFAGDPYGMAMFRIPTRTRHGASLQTITPLTEFVYEPVTQVGDRRVGVAREGKQGFLDLDGKEVVPCIYDEIGLFRMGRAVVRKGDHYGIIDTLGNIVLPIEYDDYSTKGNKYVYYDSLALVERDGLLGYVDLQGNIVIPLRFKEAYHFSQGLAPVLFNGGWGYINTRGDIHLPFIFDIASPFRWGRAEVYFQGIQHKINLQGKCLSNCNGIISFR